VTWTELFYDLFYVGALFNISHSMSKHPTAGEAVTVLLYNTLFYWTWYQYTGDWGLLGVCQHGPDSSSW
jgi:low temperature requirement protein LtrA